MMLRMPAFVIANIDVHDPVKYEDYKRMAPASIHAHGGKYIARGGAVEALEGQWQPKRLVILEFPSLDAAHKWWNSPEYTKARAVRQSCSSGSLVIVEGLDVPL